MPRTSAKVGLGDERCLASRHVGLEPVRLEDLDVLLMAGDGGSLGISIRGGNELRGISMRESREICLDRLSQRTVFCTISTAAMYCRPGASARAARIFSSDMANWSSAMYSIRVTNEINGKSETVLLHAHACTGLAILRPSLFVPCVCAVCFDASRLLWVVCR
jgi:hypothetical protein